MATGATLSIQVVSDVARATRDINQVAGSVSNLESTSRRAGSGMRAAFTGMVAGATFAVVNKGIGLITGSIGDAIKRVDTLSNANKVFAAMGFSAKDTAATMKALNSDISGLPTSMDQAVGGVQQLAAASGNLKQGEKIYAALNDAVLGFGGSTADVNSTIVQFGQAVSAGKLDAATWNSLVQTMGPALRAMANDMGMSTAKLKAGLSKGTISIGEFNRELIKMNTKGGGGMKSFQTLVKAATSGIGTSFANMRTSVVRGLANILTAIGPQNIAGAINGIGKLFEKGFGALVPIVAKVSAKIGPLAAQIGPALTKAFESKGAQQGIAFLRDAMTKFAGNVAAAVKAIVPALQHIATALAPMAKGAITAGIGAVGGAFKILGPLIKTVASAAAAFVKAIPASVIQILATAILGYVAAVKGMAIARAMAASVQALNVAMTANPIGLVVAALAGLVAALVIAYKKSATFRAIVNGAFNALRVVVSKVIPPIRTIVVAVFGGIATYFRTVFKVYRAIFNTTWTVLKTITRAAWQVIRTVIVNPIQAVRNTLASVTGKIRNIVSTAWGAIRTATRAAWQAIRGAITSPFSAARSTVASIGGKIRSSISAAWSAVRSATRAAWSAVHSAVANGVSAVASTVANLPGKIGAVAGKMLSAGTSLGRSVINGINSGLRSAVSFAGDLISSVRNAINSALHLPLRISFDKGPIHIHATVIPALATGGIVNSPTLALIGEAGPEAVVPLTGPNRPATLPASSSGPIVVEVYLDGTLIDRKVQRAMGREARRVVLRGATA